MARTWIENFRKNLDDTSAATGIPLPAPDTLFKSAGAAVATTAALLNAFRVVAPKSAVTMAQLFAAAAAENITILGAAAASELLAVAGGISAAFYIGAVIGAAIAATDDTYLHWMDQLIDWATAKDSFSGLSVKATQVGIPVQSKPGTASPDPTKPVNVTLPATPIGGQCSMDDLPSGWPTTQMPG